MVVAVWDDAGSTGRRGGEGGSGIKNGGDHVANLDLQLNLHPPYTLPFLQPPSNQTDTMATIRHPNRTRSPPKDAGIREVRVKKWRDQAAPVRGARC